MIKSSASIFLIEDDRVDVMTVQRALNRYRIKNPLYVARIATEALAMLRGDGVKKVQPSLILLDLNLPKMSGIEFLKELRSDPNLKDMTVIVLTSSNEPNDRKAAFKYEVEDYIVKPHSFDEFASAINTVLNYVIPVDSAGS